MFGSLLIFHRHSTREPASLVCDSKQGNQFYPVAPHSQLVGALSPVNHKGLHHGCTQTSLYLQVSHFTSHHTTSHVVFSSLFIFRGHSTREPVSSRLTYFILRAYAGTGFSHSQRRKKTGRGFRKNAGEWTGRVEISKEEIHGSKRSMYGYILTYSRL